MPVSDNKGFHYTDFSLVAQDYGDADDDDEMSELIFTAIITTTTTTTVKALPQL